MFSKLLKSVCLTAALSCCLLPSQAQEKWEERFKMPYSGDKILFLRQFTHDLESSPTGKSYFEFYQLNLKALEKHPRLDCSNLLPVLSNNIKTKLQQAYEIEKPDEIEAVFPTTVAETLCTDLNQNGQPEILLKVSSGFYFGKHHYGIFLYELHGEQILNLLGPDPSWLWGDHIAVRSEPTASEWPDLLVISQAPGVNSRLIYLEPLSFSTAAQKYESSPLKYANNEKIYSTQNRKLSSPDFNASFVHNQKIVLNRSGSLAGFLHREALSQSGWFADELMVVETQSGRAEQVYLGDQNKGLYQALKKNFPKYMQTPGFAHLEPEILGFNQDNLIFKLNIFGSCHDSAPSPLCHGGMGTDHDQIEKQFPRRFAGYWTYHYRTGALKLISWDSKAPINVEHTGYDVEFR